MTCDLMWHFVSHYTYVTCEVISHVISHVMSQVMSNDMSSHMICHVTSHVMSGHLSHHMLCHMSHYMSHRKSCHIICHMSHYFSHVMIQPILIYGGHGHGRSRLIYLVPWTRRPQRTDFKSYLSFSNKIVHGVSKVGIADNNLWATVTRSMIATATV